jgi:nucleoid-associated protein YgaU
LRTGTVSPCQHLPHGIGDTLSEIAEAQLGDSSRWPEIHDLNRDIVPNPNRTFPGQVLILPR